MTANPALSVRHPKGHSHAAPPSARIANNRSWLIKPISVGVELEQESVTGPTSWRQTFEWQSPVNGPKEIRQSGRKLRRCRQ